MGGHEERVVVQVGEGGLQGVELGAGERVRLVGRDEVRAGGAADDEGAATEKGGGRPSV